MDEYVTRTLTYRDDKGEISQLDDDALAKLDRPLVILGEPGMGKTRLLERLAEKHDWPLRSAASFVSHPNPARLRKAGGKIVIDGLDELSAAQESDPVCRVLGKLIEAGCPSFILSCRLAEWRGAIAHHDISTEYGSRPLEFAIEPFTEAKAIAHLTPTLGAARAAEVISYLDDQGIPDLFGNPLTLRLFGEVAEKRAILPNTRGELMKAACEIMWSEHNDRHDRSRLSNMDEATALAAAGAACAAYILTGSEAISLRPSSAHQSDVLRVAEIQALPAGEPARALIGSRLFAAVAGVPDHFKPIHRTVAEFLGARWLASRANDGLTRQRILAMLTLDAGVPASLRGLHAWLAQDSALAPAVIATDPFGVLRYGDPDNLSIGEGRAVLGALQLLQRQNPYFYADESGARAVRGLADVGLRDDVRAILVDEGTTFHLRTLLLDAMSGSALARSLVDDLLAIVTNATSSYHYGERFAAACTLAKDESNSVDWPSVFDALISIGDDDSTRLVLEVLEKIKFKGIKAELVAQAVLAHLGLLDSRTGDETEARVAGVLYLAIRRLPDAMVCGVLDSLAAILPPLDVLVDYRERDDLVDTVTRLIARQLDIAPPSPPRMVTWFRLVSTRRSYSRDQDSKIEAYFRDAPDVRSALLRHVVFAEQGEEALWKRLWRLSYHCGALAVTSRDVVWLLDEIAAGCDRSKEKKALWRELASFAQRIGEVSGPIVAAAKPYALGDPALEAHLRELEEPVPLPEWQVEQERQREAVALSKASAYEKDRVEFAANVQALRAGELRQANPVAAVYLARTYGANEALEPAARIRDWLGSDLQKDALYGLEAVLHRDDLPSAKDTARSYAESKRRAYFYPMIAGVVERVLTDRGLDGITTDVIHAARIGLEHEVLGEAVSQDRVVRKIDAHIRRDPAQHERFVRTLIEPSLEAKCEYVSGLHALALSTDDKFLAVKLSTEWLRRFDDLPVRVELGLIDILAKAGEFETLMTLGGLRRTTSNQQEERTWNWLAVQLLCDFGHTSKLVGPLGTAEGNLLWHLRHRLNTHDSEAESVSRVKLKLRAWIVEQFRNLWPQCGMPAGGWSGETNPWDATAFLRDVINRIAADTSADATEALAWLGRAEHDGYSDQILHAADQQRRARRELAFPAVPLAKLKDVIERRAPQTSDDLLAVVRYALARVKAELRGNDTDSVRKYWHDDGTPWCEDRCTDLLTEDLARHIPNLGITRIPQADMPKGKIADLLYTIGDAALPIECKCQQNEKLWTAAGDQLDAFYIADWRVQDRGIYLVYWFGQELKLKSPPGNAPKPRTPEELRDALVASISPARRGSIWVEVVDLTWNKG
jgi:hypothetical protein